MGGTGYEVHPGKLVSENWYEVVELYCKVTIGYNPMPPQPAPLPLASVNVGGAGYNALAL